jgi:CubicO group peptidase (beta-lactamase class C family)
VELSPLLDSDAPGVAVAIVEKGKVALDQGYGYADLSTKTGVTSDTRFDIASLTKTFIGLGVMLLYQKSLKTRHPIKLNAPISKYITKPIVFDLSSSESFTLPAACKNITVRQLLTMSSGIQDNPTATQLSRN